MKIITKTVVKDYVSKKCPFLVSLELKDRSLIDLLKKSIDSKEKYRELILEEQEENDSKEQDEGFNLYEVLQDYPHLRKEIFEYEYQRPKNAVEQLVERYVDNQMISHLSRRYFEIKYGKERCKRCDVDDEGSEFVKQDFIVMMTKQYLQDPSVKVIFEGQIEFKNLRARFDVLIKNEDGTFDIIEVKGTNDVFTHPAVKGETKYEIDTKIKDKYLYDLLFQYHVYLKVYPRIRSLKFMFTNRDYKLKEDCFPVSKTELDDLFVIKENINLKSGTLSLREYLDSDAYVDEAKGVLSIEDILGDINEIAKQSNVCPKESYLCRKGPACPFIDMCFKDASDPDSIFKLSNWNLYGGDFRKTSKLFNENILKISKVNTSLYNFEEIKTNSKGEIRGRSNVYTQIQYAKNEIKEKYVIDLDLVEQILKQDYLNDKIDYLLFFDFESFQYPIPLVEHIGPWKQVVNQYSMHVVEKNYDLSKHDFDKGKGGGITHFEYIANPDVTGFKNPCIELYATLKQQLESVGIDPYASNYKVVVFNRNFEKSRMNEFVRDFITLAKPELLSFVGNFNKNVVDLLDFFTSGGVYSKDFNGRGSLKVVQPTLRDDQDVQNFYNKFLPYDIVYTLDYHKGDKCLVYNGAICLDLYKSLLIRAHLGENKKEPSTKSLLDEALAYCKIDSWGTVIIYDVIKNIYDGKLRLDALYKRFGSPIVLRKE